MWRKLSVVVVAGLLSSACAEPAAQFDVLIQGGAIHVLVNGDFAVRDSEFTGSMAGEAIRRG